MLEDSADVSNASQQKNPVLESRFEPVASLMSGYLLG